jgi:hypothetical protein
MKVADLYGLPPEEFTSARNELARELKRGGKKEAAAEVAALRKPTRSVWAVNQIARRMPQETKALVKAGDELRKAQRAAVSGRGPESLREAQRAHRRHLDELGSFARDELELPPAIAHQAAQTLRAASIDKEASKSLLKGMLADDVEQAGFGPMLGVVPAGRPRPKPKAKPQAKPPKPKPDPRIKERAKVQGQLDKARERVAELEARLRDLS